MRLVERHTRTYSHHGLINRLKQMDLSESSYHRLKKGVADQRVRESAIPEEDIKAMLEFIMKNPEIGANKIRLSLLGEETAYISTANTHVSKQALAEMADREYQRRKENEKQMEALLHQNLSAHGKDKDYKHFRALYPDHIWAIDFVNLVFQGITFVLCVIYDEYSQKYLALGVGFTADHGLACDCLERVLSGPAKPLYVRRDNGKPFLTELYEQLLGTIRDYPIPPHSPWWNGSLESCNQSLKAAIKTTGMQEMVEKADVYREARKDREALLETLTSLVGRVQTRLNEYIARDKHGTTPANAYSGQADQDKERRKAFIERKRRERSERMEKIRADPKKAQHKLKTMAAKVKSIGRKLIGQISTDELFVLVEALHHRYRMFEA